MSEDLDARVDLPVVAPSRRGLNGDFCAFLDAGELRVQRCLDCGRLRNVPRYLCPRCHGDRFEWIRSRGEGELFSWTTTVRQLHPAFAAPFSVGVVALVEGVRIVAPIRGAQELHVGLPVRLAIEHPADGVVVAAFTTESADTVHHPRNREAQS